MPAAQLERSIEEQPGLRALTQGNEKVFRCPLPGRVISVEVVKGQSVKAGEEICVLECMKMEQSVRIGRDGIIKSVKIKINQAITAGAPLLELQ